MPKSSKHNKLKGWKELPPGAVVQEPGSSQDYQTGNWNPDVEVQWIPETCINCNLCWTVCPDEAIIVDEQGNMKGVNQDFCKKCGLCVDICPTKSKSLKMVKKQKEDI
ncbi:MAG: 4Fe-4S binding protein [Candidatus Gracilibacteria bacterium]|nr:4Fe-4S binding protein [Candidatus Gracilibacteria bacterium]